MRAGEALAHRWRIYAFFTGGPENPHRDLMGTGLESAGHCAGSGQRTTARGDGREIAQPPERQESGQESGRRNENVMLANVLRDPMSRQFAVRSAGRAACVLVAG